MSVEIEREHGSSSIGVPDGSKNEIQERLTYK